MNIIEFLKNGSGIYIKPSLRGSFTKYCNGKVTEECIRRGKNSPNPKIRKKATFALNARRWKHKEGGKAFATGVSVLDSNPKAYKEVKKKYKMRSALQGTKFFLKAGDWINNNLELLKGLGTSIISGINLTNANLSMLKAAKTLDRILNLLNKNKVYNLIRNLIDDPSTIVKNHTAYLIANEIEDTLNNYARVLALLGNQSSPFSGVIDSIGGIASSVLNNPNLFKKNSTNLTKLYK